MICELYTKPLIEDELNDQLNLIAKKLFEGNRIMDRMMSELEVKFVMNNSSSYLHPRFSHALPLLADDVSNYQGSRNNLTIYYDTPTDSTDYATPADLFHRLFDYMQGLENTIKDVVSAAEASGDRMTKVFLESFLLKINLYTNQSILLSDKSDCYGDNVMDFDRDIEKFIIIPELS